MSGPYDFKHLKSRVPIDRVLASYGLLDKLKQKNHQLFGPCPLHGGDNLTAFRARMDRGIWNCFTVCGGGDTVDLIRKIENCSFPEAARIMQRLSDELPAFHDKQSNYQPKSEFRPFKKQISLNFESPFLQQKKRISIATAIRFETGIPYQSTFLKGTVAVRLHDLTGDPLGYCGRRLHENEIAAWGKWRFPNNFPKNKVLYNAHRAFPVQKYGIILVECPWAAMRLTQAGFSNVVALLGASISSIQLDWLSSAPFILLMLDGDNAGKIAAYSIAEKLYRKTKTIIHKLPDGLDPDDLSDSELKSILNPYFPFSL